VLNALEKIPGESKDLDVVLSSLDGGFAPAENEMRFDVKMTATRTGEVRLDTTEEISAELAFEAQAEAAFVATLEFDYTFGVDQDSSDEFFLTVRQFETSLVIGTCAPTFVVASDSSTESLEVEDGVVDLEAQVSVEFDEAIAEDGRVTMTELDAITPATIDDFVHLAAAGALIAELPVTYNSEVEPTDSGGPTIYIYIHSDDLFGEGSPEVSVKTDITALKEPILDTLKDLSEVGGSITDSDVLNTILPVIDNSINQLFSDSQDMEFGKILDLYTPALAYFTLLEVFNFDLTDQLNLSKIGALTGIDTVNFDLENVAHRTKLKALIESEYDLSGQGFPDQRISASVSAPPRAALCPETG
jgi:hypothetical protein